jgi:hypothetical protein
VNEKKIGFFIIVVIILATLAMFITDHRGKSLIIRELNRRLSSLDREHGERQRSIEANLGELGKLSQNAIASLDGAGAIVARTGSQLQGAAGNLRDAKKILTELAIQIEGLQMELDRCRADLYRIRNLAGEGTGE